MNESSVNTSLCLIKCCKNNKCLNVLLIWVYNAPLSKKYFLLYPLNHVESFDTILPIVIGDEYIFKPFFKQSIKKIVSSPPFEKYAPAPKKLLNFIFLILSFLKEIL